MNSNWKYIWNKETGVVRPCPDVLEWARWFENTIADHPLSDEEQRTAPRTLAYDRIGNVQIYTSFLGIDHGFGLTTPPILWETMSLTNNDRWDDQRRYHTREEALAGHAELVEVKKQQSPPLTERTDQ